MRKISPELFSSSFPFFKKAPAALIDELLARMQPFSCPPKTQLYFDGDACSQIAFVLSGEIRVYKIGETGREITLYEIGPGETCILNASCILSNSGYPANAITLSECELLMLPAKEFRVLIDKYESVRNFVFSLLSERLAVVMALIEEVVFARLDERLVDYLVEKSEDNKIQTTHQNIANDLGSSREVVSRLLKDLERQGKITLSRNRIELLDI